MQQKKIFRPIRIALLILLPLVFAAICAMALYDLQIVNGAAYLEKSQNTIVTREPIEASRGIILDRYGRTLVSNRITYRVVISRSELVAGGRPNEDLLTLIDCADRLGLTYEENLPVSMTPPFTYTEPASETVAKRLEDYIDHFDLDDDISAPKLIEYMRRHYSIPESFTDEQARLAAGLRWELELRSLFSIPEYVFSDDADIDLISMIGENNLSGVNVTMGSARVYHTEYAPHILGYIGLMSPEDYEIYKNEGYPMDATIGKAGVERTFESILHGTDGVMTITRDSSGNITSIVKDREAVPGDNIVLTLDIQLQQAAEDALSSTIAQINANRLEEFKEKGTPYTEVSAGAVVAVEVGTGDVLASATYPSYDPAKFKDYEYYQTLLADPRLPLFNRALQGTYSPGSTFKIVTAVAGLDEHVISTGEKILDETYFDKYEDYKPKCWIAPGSHGEINVTEALTVSCNYFFYTVGTRLGIDKLAPYGKAFGLGQATGIELPESRGTLASREYKEEFENMDWFPGDTLQASMGQSYNLFTPLQLASYCATIASGGTRYATHILDSVKSNDGTVTLRTVEPEVLSTVDINDEYLRAIKDGMLGVSREGTAKDVFGNYYMDVCSKTGTVQLGKDVENNAVFIAFAPYDDPEIAVAIVVEDGGAGSAVTRIARTIFDYYFTAEEAGDRISAEGSLIR